MAALLTVREVAERSKLSEKTVRRAIHSGELEAKKLRGCWRIREAAYEAWVDSGDLPAPRVVVLPTPAAPASRSSLAALRRIEGETAA